MLRTLTAAALAIVSTTAGAATLTFDSLTTTVFTTTYSEAGYTLAASSPTDDTHIGDSFNHTPGTFGWHPGELNADPQAWSLTRDDGRAFGFLSFDFGAFDISVIDVSAPGQAPLSLGSGTHMPDWTVKSVTFSFTIWNEGWIDNIVLNDSPEIIPLPGALPLGASALAMLSVFGVWSRRRA